MAKFESPARMGDKGKPSPSGPAPAGGKYVSPSKESKGETKNHDNGPKG